MGHADDRSIDLNSLAIVGMAVRLPGASNLDQFWDLLCSGKDAIRFFSRAELLAEGAAADILSHPKLVASRGCLDDVDQFAASFFGISPREAALIDPQHRIMMEVAWHAMEHAGYDPEQWDGDCSIFTSAGMNTYLPFNIFTNPGLIEEVGGFQLSIYNDKDFVPTRIAYALNSKGPAIDIGTACSSSLVATHMACQHLLSYQSDLALVGGVTIHLPQVTGNIIEPGSAYSPDGRCRPFDAEQSGLVDGNGAAAIVLKRLEDALEASDTIHGVIVGSAINNDGSDKVGYSAPSIQGQAEVISEAQALAQINADQISFVEAHGTATPLGDPIEVAGLTQAFRETTERRQFCGLGSVKSNIGHVDKAAGLAGLIKVVLGLKNDLMPPTAHFTAPNPKLNIESTPFFIPAEPLPWPRTETGRRFAGVSSFGVGGTNAHAILSEAPLKAKRAEALNSPELIVLSAKTETALATIASDLAASLHVGQASLPDIAYTLQVGRKAHEIRASFVAENGVDLRKKLESLIPRAGKATANGVAFLFSGQGSQYPGMGQDLYATTPEFRDSIDTLSALFHRHIGIPLTDLLFDKDKHKEKIKQTQYAQPALFAVEYAIAQLLRSWGIEPSIVLGHSLGEYVAACYSGLLPLEDAARVVSARGRIMQSMAPGRMLAVTASASDLRALLVDPFDRIDIALINGESQTVVAGSSDDIAAFAKYMTDRGSLVRELDTSHAFHSRMMDSALPELHQILRDVSWGEASIPIISNLSGEVIDPQEMATPDYWCSQLRSTVEFQSCLTHLGSLMGDAVWLEIGPGRSLTSLASAVKRSVHTNLPTLPPANSSAGERAFLLATLGKAWEAGVLPDWQALAKGRTVGRIPLPSYPFERGSFWTAPGEGFRAVHSSEVHFYAPEWALAPSLSTESIPPRRVKVIGADHMLRELLEQRYRKAGQTVTAGTIASELPEVIVFLADCANPAHSKNHGFEKLLQTVHEVATCGKDYKPTFALVGHHIFAADKTDPESINYLLPVLLRTWKQERLGARAFSIDIPAGSDGKPADVNLDAVVRESLSSADGGDVIIRGGTRLLKQFIPLPEVQVDAGISQVSHRFLVIGGDTPIGLVIADTLVSIGAKEIYLTRETASPSAAGERHDLLDQWRDSGVDVSLVTLDPGDFSTLGRLKDAIGEPKPIGVIDASDFHSEKHQELLEVIDPTRLEQEILAHTSHLTSIKSIATSLEAPFVMLMSSLSADLGAPKQSVSALKAMLGEHCVSLFNRAGASPWFINYWGQWSESRPQTITPEKGKVALTRLFRMPNPQGVRISGQSLSGLSESASSHGENDHSTRKKGPSGTSAAPPVLDPPPGEDPIELSLIAIWQSFLQIDRIGVDEDFFALGGNSLLGAQLLSEINHAHDVLLEIGDLFEHSTIRTLSVRVFEKQTDQFEASDIEAELDRLESLSDDQVRSLLEGAD